MNVKLQAVVLRIDGKVHQVEPIADLYTAVQMVIKSDMVDKLDDEAIRILEGYAFISEPTGAILFGENEAKDVLKEIGNLTIQIEDFEVEVKDL